MPNLLLQGEHLRLRPLGCAHKARTVEVKLSVRCDAKWRGSALQRYKYQVARNQRVALTAGRLRHQQAIEAIKTYTPAFLVGCARQLRWIDEHGLKLLLHAVGGTINQR